MKNILSMVLFADPRSQGGIESFNRILKEFYPDNFNMITLKNNRVKLYNIENIMEIGSNNIIYRIFNKILKNYFWKVESKKKIKELKAEIFLFTFPFEGEILKEIKGKKICIIHTTLDRYISILCENKREKLLNLINYTDKFVVLSKYNADILKQEIPEIENKIKVIRNSSNIMILEDKKKKNKNLVMINRIENISKRIDLAVRVMKKLPDFTLNIYGAPVKRQDEEDYQRLKEILKKEKINNVFFKGITNKVQEKLDESGIYIMTSDFEGYPISLIEAMRRGLPIVLRDTFDAAKDIVVENQNGILLEKEWNEDKFVEAVRKIYDNYEYYSENSKKLGKRYSKETIKKEWDNLLNEI